MAWELQIASWGLRCIAPAINAYRRWRRKPSFVERFGSGWSTGEDGQRHILTLLCSLTVTNESRRDGLIIVRVQARRGRWFAFWHRLQDSHFCDIGEERVGIPGSPGVLIPPHTSMPMQFPQPLVIKTLPRPRTKMLSFRIVATDQFGDRHSKQLRLRRFNAGT
jgi:hypothetical protein